MDPDESASVSPDRPPRGRSPMTSRADDPRLATIEARLREFIVDELLEEQYAGSDPLADRAVDSLAVEQLVEYIGEAFGVELRDDEMVEENFDTLATLAALVDARR